MPNKTLALAFAATVLCHGAFAMDTVRFRSIVADTIAQIDGGEVDADTLIKMQQELVAIGVEGAREFAAATPEHARLMNYLVEQADEMVQMDLDGIEMAWHDGEALADIGIDIDALDHFGPAIGHMDAVVHPATAIIALREYSASGDGIYLAQVKDELSEVIEHLSHIE